MNFKVKKKDQYRGHKGKILRQKQYQGKKKNHEIIDEELEALELLKQEVNISDVNFGQLWFRIHLAIP